MSKRRPTSVREPRKEPKQERSRQTYQAILKGAAKTIRKNGVQKFSTNKVARESGVSIGSLYQYFPSKEAIVAALIDQIFEVEYLSLQERFRKLPQNIGAREAFKKVFSYYYIIEPEELSYRKVLIDAVAWMNKNEASLKFHKSLAQLILEFSQEHFGGLPVERDDDVAVFLIQYMLRATAFSSVDRDLSRLDLEYLMDELSEILMDLLKIPPEYRGTLSKG